MILLVALNALIFAIAAGLALPAASLIAQRIERFSDGPPPVIIKPVLIVAFWALVGACVGYYLGVATHPTTEAILRVPGSPLEPAVLFSSFVFVLTACVMVDARTGIVPDILTVPAIAIALLAAAINHAWQPIVGAAFLFFPFAITAWRSKGLGMGWGDVKLVTLAGAALGAPRALLGAIIACILTVIIAKFRGRMKEPVAFAPYLVFGFGITLMLAA